MMIARAAVGLKRLKRTRRKCQSRFLGDHGCTGTERIGNQKGRASPTFFVREVRAELRLPGRQGSDNAHP